MDGVENKTGELSVEELVCIMCPLGCRLKVRVRARNDQKEVVEIEGHTCKRGQEYANEEILDPKRIVTATCKIRTSGGVRRFPVKTDATIPVDCINGVLQQLYKLSIAAPVQNGDIVLENVDGRGTNVIATKTFEK